MKKLTIFTSTIILNLGVVFNPIAVAQEADASASDSFAVASKSDSSPLLTLQHEWAHINYELDETEKEKAFVVLLATADELVKANPNNPQLAGLSSGTLGVQSWKAAT